MRVRTASRFSEYHTVDENAGSSGDVLVTHTSVHLLLTQQQKATPAVIELIPNGLLLGNGPLPASPRCRRNILFNRRVSYRKSSEHA